IAPASARVFEGASLRLRAAFAGAAGGDITWSLIGPGSMAPDGTYTAPSTPGQQAIIIAGGGGTSVASAVLVVAPPPADAPLAFVACYDDGTLDVRDPSTYEDIGTASIGDAAAGVVSDPREHLAVIAAGNRIGLFDVSTGTTIFSDPIAGARFSEVAMLANGFVAATDNQAAAGQDGVRIFGPIARGQTPKLAASSPTGDTPEGIAVSSDGRTFYITNVNTNSVMRFSFDGHSAARLTGAAVTGHRPFGVAVDDKRRLLFVADNDTPTLSGASSQPGLEIFSLPSLKLVRRVATGSPNALPLGIAVDSSANRMFVTNEGDGDVAAYSISPFKRIATLAVGRTPWLPAIDSVAGSLLVPNAADDTLSVYDIGTLRPIATAMQTCGYPTAVAARAAAAQ
ncbi:MAG TPA: SMP-30/gluconolactonase/LRE family protein, partial [Candidatus Eremiobacteraceae bacterium]|nr:SMP-30/gluconolactonase/LRE family protein [Candidatus Eremiobacteraceae bacterium]